MKKKEIELNEIGDKLDTEDYVSLTDGDLNNVEKMLDVLELILNHANVGILFVDPKGIIRFMNQRYEDLIGIDRKESIGKKITDFFPDASILTVIKTKKAKIEFYPGYRLPFIRETKKAEVNHKSKYRGKGTLIVNRIPIFKDRKFVGAIAQSVFRDIETIKEMTKKMDMLETKVQNYKSTIDDLLKPKYKFEDIIGISEAIIRLKNIAGKYAKSENTILIGGETGTGKELFAHSIHQASKRNEGPLVCVNCASIPNELLESELFGYAPGAFTGAQKKGKLGKIELANGGTLFLDEIGDLPLTAQAKLLRVLDEKRVEKVGDVLPVEVNFRLIAATNKKLDFLMNDEKFRQDLFYRLSTMTLEIPPLRDRTEDIPILINHFIQKSSTDVIRISDYALNTLMDYAWPGNVRELKNLIELSICVVPKGDVFELNHLPQHIIDTISKSQPNKDVADFILSKKIKNDEIQLIKKALNSCRGNKSRAAKLLGISRSSLYNKIRDYSLQ